MVWIVCILLVVCNQGCRFQPENSVSSSEQEQEEIEESGSENNRTVSERYLTFVNVGQSHYEASDFEQATLSFEQAFELLPNEIGARLNLARVLFGAQKFSLTLDHAKEVISMDRHSMAAHYLAGLSLMSLGETRQAIAYFEKVIRQDPSNAVVQFQLAMAFKSDRQLDRFRQALQSVVLLDENHWSAFYQLAQDAMARKEIETATDYMARFQKLSSSIPAEKKTAESLQHCSYMEIDIPEVVHQPEMDGIAVSFAPRELPWQEVQSRILAAGDTDQDSDLDLVVYQSARGLFIAVNSGEGQFEEDIALKGSVDFSPTKALIADYDNDRDADILVFGKTGFALLQQSSDGTYVDVSQTSNLQIEGGNDFVWLDYDHDGDLDVLAATSVGLSLFGNRGNGTFEDHTELARIPEELGSIFRLQVTDMDGDEAIDFIVSPESGSIFEMRNDGLGMFVKTEIPLLSERISDDQGSPSVSFYVEDFDNDLRRDVINSGTTSGEFHYSSGQQGRITTGDRQVLGIVPIDYDNDGWLDALLKLGMSGAETESSTLRLYRNVGAAGWENVTDKVGLSQLVMTTHSEVLVGDIDQDGDSDLVLTDSEGHPQWYSNEGGNQHKQMKLFLTGTKSNRSGIGTLIEIRTGSFRLSRMVSELPVEIGLGTLTELDSLRTIWPNGIVKNDIWVKTTNSLSLEEPFVSAGSCPYLYAWDGKEFRFITDILGAAPLGLSLKRGVYAPAKTGQFIWVGNQESFVPDSNGYRLRITDELREILYLDQLQLVAVDHPEGTEVHPTDKFQPPPNPPSKLLLVENRIPLRLAIDQNDRDWTSDLLTIDKKRYHPPLRAPQLRGLAERHSLTLDFGLLDSERPLVLAMTGWLMWGDASVNIAASQNPDLPNPWPQLEAFAQGKWETLNVIVGTPEGKTKTMLVDLTHKLPKEAEKLRWTSGFEIYWDRIALFENSDQNLSGAKVLPALQASLQWRGFAEQTRLGPTGPIEPNTDRMSFSAPWKTTLSGWCTRYGDVMDLISKVDDEYVIFNGGDSMEVHFQNNLSPLPEGMQRSFFIYCDGWDKDGDYNVVTGNAVEPLPYHGMNDQDYGKEHAFNFDPNWIKTYNTRWVLP